MRIDTQEYATWYFKLIKVKKSVDRLGEELASIRSDFSELQEMVIAKQDRLTPGESR